MPDARTESNRTDTLRLARPESIVEARPKPAMPGAEEMFLSPRVLDAGAFARYAEMLKALIGEARQGARDLQDFSADADQMIAGCEKAGEQIRVRLEAGARVVRMIDERADRAETILDTVRRELPNQERVRELIEPAVSGAIDAARQRAAEITVENERRARTLASEIEQKLAAMTSRAEEQAVRLERAGRTIEERLSAFESRLGTLLEQADLKAAEFEARTRAATEAAERTLTPVLSRATEAAGSIDDALARAWRHAEQKAGQITERLVPLQQACDAVLDRLGLDPADPDPSGSVLHRLDDLVQRAEVSLQGSQRVIGQMEHLRGQAEGVRSQFGAWLLDAASELDRLEARREELAGPLSTAAEKVMRVTPVLADDLKIAVTTLDQLQLEQTILREAVQAGVTLARHTSGELNNQSAQLKALIDGSVLTLSRRVEEAGRWLGELIVRAEEAGHRVEPCAALPAVKAAESVMANSPACVIAEVTGWATQPVVRAPTPAAATEVTPKVSFTPPLPANSYGLPLPPALPIDALSFDGAPVVFGHGDSESAD
jgi:hypothetical protein